MRSPKGSTWSPSYRAIPAWNLASYEEIQETMALLKILALGNKQIEQGKAKPVADVVKRLKGRKAGD